MSIGQDTVELWKRALPWRFSLICAIAATALAVMAGNHSPPLAGASGTQGSPAVATGPSLSSSNPTIASQQCGPQGMLTLQAPIVVSSTGAVPANVQSAAAPSVSQGGIPANVLSHFRQFFTKVDAANLEQRLGERCAQMHGALGTLDASDYAYADCFQDGEKKLVAGQSCASDFDASEIRFARLIAAFAATKSDSSANLVEELARSRTRMLPFDETRERWGLSDVAVAAGDAAVRNLRESDQRIADLEALGTIDTSTPDSLERLTAAGNKLTAMDRSRLTPQAREILSQAETARVMIQDSDSRLNAVSAAMQKSPAIDAAHRATLITTLSALTDWDMARANAAQNSTIETARKTAAEFALVDLVTAVAGVDISLAPPDELERIRDLAMAAQRYGDLTAANAESKKALSDAEQAAGRLEQSDQRIIAMRDLVVTIEAGGPSALNNGVVAVFDSVSNFDRERMSDSDLQAYAQLGEARKIVLASLDGKLTKSVPIYLRTESTEELSILALADLHRELEDRGFTLVDALERAAVEMRMDLSEVTEKSVKMTGSTIKTAEVSLTLRSRWTVTDKAITVPKVDGTAAGDDINSLSREAASNAAMSAADEIAKLAGP